MILKNLNMRLLSLNWNNPPCLNSFHIILYWLMFSATCLLLVNGDQHKIDNYTSVKCPDKICKDSYAEGQTSTEYNSVHELLLPFHKGTLVKINGKTSDEKFLFVQLSKYRGFVPSSLVKILKEDTMKALFDVQISDIKSSILTPAMKPKRLDSSIVSESSEVTSETPVLESIKSESVAINDQPSVISTASLDKVTVIDGTTLPENLLVISTPSPSYSAQAVTKTATIPAEFPEKEIVQIINETNSAIDSANAENIVSSGTVSETPKEAIVSVDNDNSTPDQPDKAQDQAEKILVPEQNQVENKVDENVPENQLSNQDDSSSQSNESTGENSPENAVDSAESKTQPEIVSFQKDSVEQVNISDSIQAESNASEVKDSVVTKEESSQDPVQESNVSSSDDVEELKENLVNTNNDSVDPLFENKTESISKHSEVLADETRSNPEIPYETQQVHVHITPPPLSESLNSKELPSVNQPESQNSVPQEPIADVPLNIVPHKQVPPGRFLNKRNPTHPSIANPTDNPSPVNQQQNFVPTDENIPPHAHNPHVSLNREIYSSPEVEENPSPKPNIDLNDSKPNLDSKAPTVDSTPEVDTKQNTSPITASQEEVPQPDSTTNDSSEQSILSEPALHEANHMVNQNDYHTNVNSNIFKRKQLTERVAFVSVIMEIIPDEVELFFENFNISLHAVIFTSIVAFFWCLMKVFVFFIRSSKKERELRDSNCQAQRKLYFIEAEKEKHLEEINSFKDKLFNHQQELRIAEKQKFQFDRETEKLKNELVLLRKENSVLKSSADATPELYSKLETSVSEQEKYKQENRELVFKIEELEEQIDSLKETVNNYQTLNKSDKEEIEHLSRKNKNLTDENVQLTENLEESIKNFNIISVENKDLKELQNKLNVEVRDLKDELLLLNEKTNELTDEKNCLELELNVGKSKLDNLSKELFEKNSEIISMQALLSKMNKNIAKDHIKRQASMEMNGDVNGNELLDVVNNNDWSEEQVPSSSRDTETETIDFQDVLKLQLKLTQIELEKQQVQDKYDSVLKEVNDAKAQMEHFKSENERLKVDTEEAVKKQTAAILELEILSKYYKEKELEYAKDIGVHWVKREQTEEDASTMSSKLEVVEEENEMLKKQIKSTKKELEETERRFKSQLNQLEKQSHENWIAARNAERKFEESKAEATALRQTLTLSVKSPPPGNADLSLTGYLDDTASSVSSVHEGLNTSFLLPPPPPPPPPFMPFLPPIPSMSQPHSLNQLHPMFDANDSGNSAYWNMASSGNNFNSLPPSYTNPMMDSHKDPVSLDSNLNISFTKANQQASTLYSQTVQANTQAQAPSTVPQAPPSQTYSMEPQSLSTSTYQYATQQPNSFNQWMDINRNTYSPMSQRSAAATPLTTNMPTVNSNPPTVSTVAYQQMPMQSQQQQQPYMAQQKDIQASDPNLYTNYNQNYNQSGYQQQQPEQIPFMSRGAPPLVPSTQSQQIWTAGQTSTNNPYQISQQHNNVYASAPTDANSRPASVHTQMV